MQHTIENEFLRVTAHEHGAELTSVIKRDTGEELLWNADPAVWDFHAPILFPYCGKLKNGIYHLDGGTYSGAMHGFARDMEHRFLGSEASSMSFVLESDRATRALLPREFTFRTTYTLSGRTLRHRVEVVNRDDRELRFGLGYHPAFTFPFDDRHTTEDYEIRFDSPQSPIVLQNYISGPNWGFISGGSYPLHPDSAVIPLNDRLFDHDSICLSGLHAKTISICEKDSNRRVTLGIGQFPYVLLWSMMGTDVLKFLAIEPWHCLQDHTNTDNDWEKKPCAAVLAPGQSWETHLDMTFDR